MKREIVEAILEGQDVTKLRRAGSKSFRLKPSQKNQKLATTLVAGLKVRNSASQHAQLSTNQLPACF
jgi:hypothetical protein